MATVEELIQKYEDELKNFPQKCALVTGPLHSIRQELQNLARQGVMLMLEHQSAAPETPFQEFPKMMYKDHCPPTVAENEEAMTKMESDGWRDKP